MNKIEDSWTSIIVEDYLVTSEFEIVILFQRNIS